MTGSGCVNSEAGRLRRVIVHRPGAELTRLTPANRDRMLFDELPWPERAAEEHDCLTVEMTERGVDVLYLRDLMVQCAGIPAARKELIGLSCSESHLGRSLADALVEHLDSRSDEALVEGLFSGVTFAELGEARLSGLAGWVAPREQFALPPLPNLLFTRDACAWVGSTPYLATMTHGSRRRESLHLEVVLRHHPLFAGAVQGSDGPLEGGDLLVPARGCVLVGMGERTEPAAVEQFARQAFDRGDAERVLAVELPHDRSVIHLDTVMTMVDRDAFTVFAPVIDRARAFLLTPGRRSVRVRDGSLPELLARSLGLESVRLLPTGGDPTDQVREQWSDANNVLALAPGVVIAYDRNVLTNEVLREAGIDVIPVPSSELGRGRGGPRCLTCPVERADL